MIRLFLSKPQVWYIISTSGLDIIAVGVYHQTFGLDIITVLPWIETFLYIIYTHVYA